MSEKIFERPNVNDLFENITFSCNESNVELHDIAGAIFDMDMKTFIKVLHAYNSLDFSNVITAYNNASAVANEIQNAIVCEAPVKKIADLAFMCGKYARFITECENDFFESTENHKVANAAFRLFEFHNGMEFYSFDVNRDDIKW